MIQPKIKFVFDRKHIADKSHKGVIELRIYFQGRQKFISTGFSVYPGEWSTKDEVKGIPEAMEINTNLSELKRRVLKVINEMLEEDCFDINEIAKRIKAKSVDITFMEYIVRRIRERSVRDNTLKAYGVFYNKLSEFGRIKTFADVNQKNITAFDTWLHNYTWTEKDKRLNEVKRSYSQATIGSFHKNLKAFIADAVVDGYMKDNPYVAGRIKIDKGATRIDKFLTPEEIEKIKKATMPTRAVGEARDLFLFACMTGISFADLMEFNPKAIHDVDGLMMYTDERVKTKQPFTCVIPDDAMKILRRYKGKLPRIPNQKYNMKLKIVADAAGIEKPITSHYARHSAAMMWLNNGIPLAIVARCLGHSAISTTVKSYAEIMDRSIAEAFKKKK